MQGSGTRESFCPSVTVEYNVYYQTRLDNGVHFKSVIYMHCATYSEHHCTLPKSTLKQFILSCTSMYSVEASVVLYYSV